MFQSHSKYCEGKSISLREGVLGNALRTINWWHCAGLWCSGTRFYLVLFLWVFKCCCDDDCFGRLQLRKRLRHRFQTTARRAKLYDVITFCATHICMPYAGFPFMLLEFIPCMRVYRLELLCVSISQGCSLGLERLGLESLDKLNVSVLRVQCLGLVTLVLWTCM